MKKVLITGAAGFIGSKLLTRFSQENFNVIGWDVVDIQRWGIDICKVDLLDFENLKNQIGELQPDIVIHCAGSADVGKSISDPNMDFARNVEATHNLLFAMHNVRLDNATFIFLSSAGVYGNPKQLPIVEEADVNPMSPYALHKIMCEDICKYFYENYKMNIKIARIFSAYGAGLKKQIFWDMYNKSQKENKFDMFGTGNESRDYIHIDDVVEALYLIATNDSNDVIINVANGEEITIRQATEWFADCVGIDKKYISFCGTVREGDPLNWKADITKLKKLGYKKTINMVEGLKEYVEWAKLSI